MFRTIYLRLIAAFLLCALSGASLFCRLPAQPYSGALAPLSDQETILSERLKGHVAKLAGEIGERSVRRPSSLTSATRYIEAKLREHGYGVSRQVVQVGEQPIENIEAELKGSSQSAEIIVVGAHYDSVSGCPGANDNGSGTAAVLEIARLMAGQKPVRTIRFVFFVNEEPPFFKCETMGSLCYAKRCKQRKERIVAMLSVETIGYYSNKKGSQAYPFPYNLFYPDTGNFISFISDLSSRKLLRNAISLFRAHSKFPIEGACAPGFVPGVGWSDHWSFWRYGYPAIMVTDTAPFRYPHYHTPSDTPDKIDYGSTARVVAGLARVVEGLSR